MHIKKRFTVLEILWWTRFETLLFLVIGTGSVSYTHLTLPTILLV